MQNSFNIAGYVREKRECLTQGNEEYYAFILTLDNGKTNIPIYCKGKVAEKAKAKCAIGCLVRAEGYFKTNNLLKNGRVCIGLYMVATFVERLEAPKVLVSKNVVFNKLIDLIDEDDLFKRYKTLAKETKKKNVK